MDKFIGVTRWAHELRQLIIKKNDLPISMGLSLNKTVSKIATGQAKPNNELQVPYGIEKAFLAPLSASKMPGIGPETYNLLCRMGGLLYPRPAKTAH